MANKLYDETAIQNIADAIRNKNGSSDTYTVSQMADAINNIPSGSANPTAEPNDVNFFDYDGACLYSYTKSEFLNLTALPENPTHEGLTAQGWNWTLADAKEYVTSHGKCDIGQHYITDDGKTRLYINIYANSLKTISFVCYSSTTAPIIDWGDGTAPETIATGAQVTPHTYPSIGYYVITITHSNVAGRFRLGNGSKNVFNATNAVGLYYLGSILDKVELGDAPTMFYALSFLQCRNMKSITIPSNINATAWNQASVFFGCVGLPFVTVGKNATALGNSIFYQTGFRYVSLPKETVTLTTQSHFYQNDPLNRVVLPDGIRAFPNNLFYFDQSLKEVICPSSLASVGTSAFAQCYSLRLIDCSLVSVVPTLSNVNAFTGCRGNIVVPDALYDEWVATSPWSSVTTATIIKKSDYDAL